MKIGIMSMQRVCNTGSFLQAYGLKRIIESFGHEVVFVDYKAEKPIYKNFKERFFVAKKRFKELMLSLFISFPVFGLVCSKKIKYIIAEKKIYNKCCYKYLGFSKKKQYRTKVDLLIIGSDEVFNFTQLNPNVGYSKELFGKNANTRFISSYAASFGNTTLKKIQDLHKEKELTILLEKFLSISVRDLNSSTIISKVLKREAQIHFDPALIYDFNSDYIPDCPEKDFIIVYAYRQRITDVEKDFILDYANKNNKRIITIGGYQRFGDLHFVGTPFEIIGYFKKADYVFTDTFHGTILSIINKKQFSVFVRKSVGNDYGNEEKLLYLLRGLKLENRKLRIEPNLKLANEHIDYIAVDSILSNERRKTFEYFNSLLNKVSNCVH